MRHLRPALLLALCAVSIHAASSSSAPLEAQEMDEGEARITASADVRLSIESGPATSSEKLALLGGAIGGKLGDVRRCYRDRTEQAPAVRGRLRIFVELQPGGGRVEVQRDELNDRPLTDCVMRALRGASFASVRPPGSAYVVLDFDNSAAEGVQRTQELRAVEDTAQVTTNAEGKGEARGGTPDGLVTFRVIGDADAAAQIQSVHRAVRASIPQLLDCRRKAARRESPAGDVMVDLRVNGARGTATSRRSTVADARGPRCVVQALGRARYEAEARGRVQVVVTFAADAATESR